VTSRVNELHNDVRELRKNACGESDLLSDAIVSFNPFLIEKHSKNTRLVSQLRIRLATDRKFLRQIATPKFTNYCFEFLQRVGGAEVGQLSSEDGKWIAAVMLFFKQSMLAFEEDFMEVNINVMRTIISIFMQTTNAELKTTLLLNMCRYMSEFASKCEEADNGFIKSEIAHRIHQHLLFYIFDSRETPRFVSECFGSICYFYRTYIVDLRAEMHSEEVV
jgi:hypothetical protein